MSTSPTVPVKHSPEFWQKVGADMADKMLEYVLPLEPTAQAQVLEACRKRLRRKNPHFWAVLTGQPSI